MFAALAGVVHDCQRAPKRTFIPEKFLISVDAASNFGILVRTMLYGNRLGLPTITGTATSGAVVFDR